MITLVTHYFPRNQFNADMFAMTSEHNRNVAKSFGWNFISDSERRLPGKSYFREKTAILVDSFRKMEDGDQVVRLDGD